MQALSQCTGGKILYSLHGCKIQKKLLELRHLRGEGKYLSLLTQTAASEKHSVVLCFSAPKLIFNNPLLDNPDARIVKAINPAAWIVKVIQVYPWQRELQSCSDSSALHGQVNWNPIFQCSFLRESWSPFKGITYNYPLQLYHSCFLKELLFSQGFIFHLLCHHNLTKLYSWCSRSVLSTVIVVPVLAGSWELSAEPILLPSISLQLENLGGFHGEQSIAKATGLDHCGAPSNHREANSLIKCLWTLKKRVSSNFSVIKPLSLSVRWTVVGKGTSKGLGLFQLKKLRCLNVLDIKNTKKAMEKVIGRFFFFPHYT